MHAHTHTNTHKPTDTDIDIDTQTHTQSFVLLTAGRSLPETANVPVSRISDVAQGSESGSEALEVTCATTEPSGV